MSDAESADASASDPSPETPPTRRNMLVECVTAVVSFVLVAVPSAIAGVFYLDPLFRRRQSGEDGGGDDLTGFIQLSETTDVIPDDGSPVAVTVKDTLDDAWNRFNDVPVGSIWLRKQPSGDIIAFNSICPHLGCSVNFRRSEGDFYCPCHTSSFDLDGKRTNAVPPRNMDSLAIVVGKDGKADPSGKELWLKFQNFRGATSEKIPI